MNRQRLWAFALSSILPLSVHGGDAGVVGLATLSIRIETRSEVHRLQVEIAATPEQRARGLMARDALAPNAGMLFLFEQPQPGNVGFWMYDTLIPIDVAFLDTDGRIRATRTMQPCRSREIRCPSYLPHVSYSAALEVNGGYLAAHHIRIGDYVVFEPPGAAKTQERVW